MKERTVDHCYVKCSKCNSSKLKEETKDFQSDNILKIYVCEDCGHKESVLQHIG